jgi:DNA-directed RNA polymerase subunit RPC12/RpoP
MRLGDTVDNYCSRCKREMDHSIVSMSGEEISKVRCRTCNYEHNFRKSKGRKEMTAKEAFDKVLASVMTTQTQPPPAKPGKKSKS